MSQTRWIPLACALSAATVGCSKPKTKHSLAVVGAPVEVRVSVNGVELAPVRLPKADYVHRFEVGSFEQPPAMSVRALMPCGWLDVPVQATNKTETEEYHAAQVMDEAQLLSLWVDNRGGDAFAVSLGKVETRVPAGFTGSFRVPAPACAEARLRVGDVEVATAQASDRGGARAYLIDGSGARCYHERVVEYGVTGVSFSPPKEQRFRPARIHALGVRVEDFLKQAPETVKVKLSEGFPSRGEVTEVPCASVPK